MHKISNFLKPIKYMTLLILFLNLNHLLLPSTHSLISRSSSPQHSHHRSSNRGSSLPTLDPPQSSSPPASPSPTRDLLAAQKCKIEALEEENNKLKNKKQKKTCKYRIWMHHMYIFYSQLCCRTMSTLDHPIYRLVSLFASPNMLLAEHNRRCELAEEEDDLADVDIEALNPAEQEEYNKRIKEKHV